MCYISAHGECVVGTRASCGNLGLANFTCLNWKTVVWCRESGPAVGRGTPNCDTHLICPVKSSPVFLTSYNQVWRNVFRKWHVGTITPILTLPWYLYPFTAMYTSTAFQLCHRHALSMFSITRGKKENRKAQMKIMYLDYITAFTEKLCSYANW